MLPGSLNQVNPDTLEITSRLPSLVSFTLLRGFQPCSARLRLLSLCTRVSQSLKNLSLTCVNLSSSDLQSVVAHLPHLEVFQCRYVLRCTDSCSPKKMKRQTVADAVLLILVGIAEIVFIQGNYLNMFFP